MKWQARIRMNVGPLDLDVSLETSQRVAALVGPNGSGKTTILRTLAGARTPAAGTIVVGDRTLFDSAAGLNVEPEDRQVGYVPQGYGLFPHLNVLDNVAFGLKRPGVARENRRSKAYDMLAEMGCENLAHRHPGDLSGGEKQRVALARALVTEPRILLLDEPLAALDTTSRRQLRAFLARKLSERGQTTLLVSHDARDIEALGAHVWILERGHVVQAGTLADLRARPATDFVAEFTGAPSPSLP